MIIERVAIDSLKHDPKNLRRHPHKNLQAIKDSLARFGQQRPILISNQNVIVAGNGTIEAARNLGWVEVDAVRTGLVNVEAAAYAIADNRTSELAEWDQAELLDVLRSMEMEELRSIGFDDIDVKDLAKLLDPDPPQEFVAVDEDLAVDYACPKCGYEWSGKPK